jgi:hypothetical protein
MVPRGRADSFFEFREDVENVEISQTLIFAFPAKAGTHLARNRLAEACVPAFAGKAARGFVVVLKSGVVA